MTIQDHLLKLFCNTRNETKLICLPLEIEDYVVQPIVDVSPPKWHLGHTTWFFEEFLLDRYLPNYTRFHNQFAFIFNSYYESVGKRIVRTDRGNLSRPSVNKVYEYRDYVTNHMVQLIDNHWNKSWKDILEIGIHHEKQHQELLLTDIKYILGNNPLLPVYDADFQEDYAILDQQWITIPEGVYEIGHLDCNFCYDNELPRHRVFLEAYRISNQLITNQQWLEFINDGGYANVHLWHTEGWDWVQKNNICSPMFWYKQDGLWFQYQLSGLKPINPNSAVTHISYYEAFAYSQWKGLRLPTEFEWEAAESKFNWGKRWEWTESAYLPYPNYKKPDGALGEYNGKFMVNQKVLRGASIATANHHIRPSYRNFFHAPLRWQFTSLRLVQSL